MERKVYKDHHLKPEKIADIIKTAESSKKILIVFWHGIGDVIMFLPLYAYIKYCFPEHKFDLALLPGVGQAEFIPNAIAIPEIDFVKDHDAAFVISFPMVEGNNSMTKTEYCCKTEVGLNANAVEFGLPNYAPLTTNKLVGLHLQGTCLPGSTNPDMAVAEMIWNDIKDAGYVPFDLHFLHVFHNPANKVLPWANRNCRDLQPNLHTLKMLIERCMAVVAVASGPFVLAASINKNKTIYLQKHHTIACYMKDFGNVIDLLAYADADKEKSDKERKRLIDMLKIMENHA